MVASGIGKTNIVDSIYHLAFTKSYFNPSTSQNVRTGSEYFSISGDFKIDEIIKNNIPANADDENLSREMHKTIHDVTQATESFGFNAIQTKGNKTGNFYPVNSTIKIYCLILFSSRYCIV